MDAAALLQPRTGDLVSGENLEYDLTFTEMELAAQPGEEQQIGSEIIPATDPDYATVRKNALAILEQSHDLRAAIFLAEAELVTNGLPAFAQVTAYIRGCLAQHWDTCHPELDAEDDDDPTMRINAVSNLSGQSGGMGGAAPVMRALRRAPLTDSRMMGRFSWRDIEIAEGIITPPEGMDNLPESASVNAAFLDTDPETLEKLHGSVTQATEDLQAISQVFDEKTPGRGPDFTPLIKVLTQIAKRLSDHTGGSDTSADTGETAPADAPADPGAAPAGGSAPAAPAAPPGAIQSQADVMATLDRIIAYYQRSEPSSPVPLLLDRAKRLVGADFMTIVKDMAPGGLDNVETVGGLEPDDDDGRGRRR